MALLTVKTRQKYLKELGFYKGKIDGINGKMTKDAIVSLQRKYFTRTKDIDGVYGNNTDILLRNAYICKNLKYFKLEEFKCNCKGVYCTGYHKVLDERLLKNLDTLRAHYGKSVIITSGLRCPSYNLKIGGVSGSRHKSGQAADIYMYGKCDTLEGRKELVNYWIENFDNTNYSYCNGYSRSKKAIGVYKSSTMGTSVHLDV